MPGASADDRWPIVSSCVFLVTRTVVRRPSGSFRRQRDRSDRSEAFRGDRVVPPVRVAAATLAFFLDIRDFAARRQLAIATGDAAAGRSEERRVGKGGRRKRCRVTV